MTATGSATGRPVRTPQAGGQVRGQEHARGLEDGD